MENLVASIANLEMATKIYAKNSKIEKSEDEKKVEQTIIQPPEKLPGHLGNYINILV